MVGVIKPSFAPRGVTAFMTTAEGGADFSRASCAVRGGLAAWEELKNIYSVHNLVTLHQVHGADIVKVNHSNRLAVDGVSADGLFTCEKGLALGILTADCYPVLIAGKNCTAALHCGWRSTVRGIIERAAELFGKNGDTPVYAYIGAGISANAYEVKDDFISEASRYIELPVYIRERSGKYFFDLNKLVADKLSYSGVPEIESAGKCTASAHMFYSYRRDADRRRMLSVIMRDT